MTNLSAMQVAAVAYDAGWRGGNYVRAVAVALAESGGNASVTGHGDPDDLGLFQVNARFHPEIRSVDWTDPLANAKVAYAVWQRDGWAPWNSSRLGQTAAMPIATLVTGGGNARPPASYPGGTGKNPTVILGQTLPGTAGGTNPLTAVPDALNRLGSWISNPMNWARVIQVGLGGILILVALSAISKPITEPVVKTVGALK